MQKGADKPMSSIIMFIGKDRRPYSVTPVKSHGPNGWIETYALLDNGTMITITGSSQLAETIWREKGERRGRERGRERWNTPSNGLPGTLPMPRRTITFQISAADEPNNLYQIQCAFIFLFLRLSDYSFPIYCKAVGLIWEGCSLLTCVPLDNSYLLDHTTPI